MRLMTLSLVALFAGLFSPLGMAQSNQELAHALRCWKLAWPGWSNRWVRLPPAKPGPALLRNGATAATGRSAEPASIRSRSPSYWANQANASSARARRATAKWRTGSIPTNRPHVLTWSYSRTARRCNASHHRCKAIAKNLKATACGGISISASRYRKRNGSEHCHQLNHTFRSRPIQPRTRQHGRSSPAHVRSQSTIAKLETLHSE